MKTVYTVWFNSDTTEGRGPMVLKGIAATSEVAGALAADCPKIMGVGANADIRRETLFESVADYQAGQRKAIVTLALSKLTKEEREALGLTSPDGKSLW